MLARWVLTIAGPALGLSGVVAAAGAAEGVGCTAPVAVANACDASCRCGPQWNATVDYLHWWVDDAPTPTLLTTSPVGTPQPTAGVLGQSTTSPLYGGAASDTPSGSGVRFDLERRLSGGVSLGGEFFWLGADDGLRASSDGDPGLMRPFFNTDPSVLAPDAELIAFDDPDTGDVLDGAAAIDARLDAWSAALACRWNLLDHCSPRHAGRLTGSIGYRYFRLDESLDVATRSVVTATGGLVAQGTTFDVRDSLDATNDFHGLELGVASQERYGPWSLRVIGKLAIGGVRNETRLAGSTVTTVPSVAPFAESGGLLAQPTNSGSASDNRFALLPELRLDLSRRLGPSTQVRVGYTLLYLTDAVRAGALVDPAVDGRFLDPGPAPGDADSPARRVSDSTVWLQGINVGLVRLY
ncbi:BBP7 family outer membrane beta-barrel protein [Botrimarina sp.]|uniref:BBP7 family outer membrane beta-barrel protein n=1 Tax=Botrimarina sp. TaxID=2795802 RepID=UPI0032ECBFE9